MPKMILIFTKNKLILVIDQSNIAINYNLKNKIISKLKNKNKTY